MKYLILFFSMSSLACENFLPKSQLELIASGVELGADVKFCKDLPKEECICYENIDLRAFKLGKKKVDVPVYSKAEVQSCKDHESCAMLFTQYDKEETCSKLNSPKEIEEIKGRKESKEYYWETILNNELMEVYCAKITSFEQVETNEIALEVDLEKKLFIEQAEMIKLQEENTKNQLKEEAKLKIKNLDLATIKKIEDVKEVLKDVIEILKE